MAAASVLALSVVASVSCLDGSAAGEPTIESLPEPGTTAIARIGSADDPDVGFSRIYDLAVDAEGLIYVFEAADMEFRVYDVSGRLIRRFGRRGGGPGEFEGAPRFGIVGDTVWAIDAGARRITLFRRDGTLLSSSGRVEELAIPLPQCFGWVTPRSMRPDGLFASAFTRVACGRDDPETDVEPGDPIPVPHVLFNAAGALVDTIGWDPGPPPRMVPPRDASAGMFQIIEVGGRRMPVPDPPSTLPVWISLNDGRIVIEQPPAPDPGSAEFFVTRVRLTGDTAWSRRFRYRPIAYTDAELDAIAAGAARGFGGIEEEAGHGGGRGAGRGSDPAVQRALREAMTFPEFRVPIQYAQTDAEERLWLIRDERAGSKTTRWILLDRSGEPLGQLELPVRARVLWSRGNEFWTVEPDELDVPWLVRYRIDGF